MDRTDAPIVVLGAGYGGLTAALHLAKKASRLGGREIVLINKHEYHQFITELHKPAAGSVDCEYIRIRLKDIIGRRPVRIVKATVERIDHANNRLILEGGEEFPFSKLIVGIGSEPEYFGIEGMKENAFTLRSLNCSRVINEHIGLQLASYKVTPPEEKRGKLTFVVGGAGLTGVEMAGELAETLSRTAKNYDINPDEIRIFNVEAVPDIMRDFGSELAQQAARDLERKGICLLTGVPITRVTSDRIELANGRMIPTKTVIWSGGVRASRLVEESGFSTVNRGRAKVDGNMRSIDNPNVFVIGDCAAGVDPTTGRVVPPTAHNAIDQGLVAAKNILADYGFGSPAVFHVVDLGAVASLGETFAVGKVGKMKLIGRPASIMKEMIELKWIFSLGGVGLVFKRLPRVLHLMRVALQRTVYHRPLVGGSCELPLMESAKAPETPSKPSTTESAATKE